jgi:glycosyltransferase involved in cell wall biosynthesis
MSKESILIVIGSFKMGGAERMALNMGEKWLEDGYEVHYALLRPIYEIPNNIPKGRIHLLGKKSGSSSKLQHLMFLVKIFLLNRKLRVSFAIGFTYYSSFVACFSLCKNVIGTFDVNPFRFAKKRAAVAQFVNYWPFTKKIICPSKGLLNHIIAEYPTFKKKGIYIYNTFEFEKVEQNSKELASFDTGKMDYVVGMGRLNYQKNFQLLIKSYSASKLKDNFKLLILGDGPLKKELSDLVSEHKLENSVVLVGFIDNPFPIIKNAKAFINTSNYESFGMVLLEALSLNVPVISTNCDFGPSELIEDGVNGKLTDVKDEVALVKLLDAINENQAILDTWKDNIHLTLDKFAMDNINFKWQKEIFEKYR